MRVQMGDEMSHEMSKGAATRQSILNRALDLTSELGLEGLTLGVLAQRAGLSKSGLYAHFDSKETLQCDVLDTAAARFIDAVLSPALKAKRGLPRLEKLFDLWLKWGNDELSHGCPFVAAATEFDDRPGVVRDRLVGHLRDMLGSLARIARGAVEEGQLAPDLDSEQFAYELWGVLVSHQTYRRLLGDPEAGLRASHAFRGLIGRALGSLPA